LSNAIEERKDKIMQFLRYNLLYALSYYILSVPWFWEKRMEISIHVTNMQSGTIKNRHTD
jgi:hypothetical protein